MFHRMHCTGCFCCIFPSVILFFILSLIKNDDEANNYVCLLGFITKCFYEKPKNSISYNFSTLLLAMRWTKKKKTRTRFIFPLRHDESNAFYGFFNENLFFFSGCCCCCAVKLTYADHETEMLASILWTV